LFTSLATALSVEETEIGVSSLIDTWLQVRDMESRGERNRAIYVIKSRGMSHSNQVREFLITDHGIQLLPVRSGPGGVLIGSARIDEASEEAARAMARRQETERKRRALRRKRTAIDGRIAELRADLAAEEDDLKALLVDQQTQAQRVIDDRSAVERRRQGGRVQGQRPVMRVVRPAAAARKGRRS
jgi:circadian clock protein KaiC